MKNKTIQPNLRQIISIHLLVWLMSVGFVFGQTQGERKLELIVQTGHTGFVDSVVFSPDGKLVASASWDKTIKLWNVETGKEIKSLIGHTSLVGSIAFSPDGKNLASESLDNSIKLWNVETGKEVKSFAGYNESFHSIAFSPDGKILASGSSDKTVKLWDVETGEEIKSLKGHTSEVWTVAFSPDRKLLASGSHDNIIKLWNSMTGEEAKSLIGHTDSIRSIAFSPDGKTLASGSDDNSIKLWNVAKGEEIKSLNGHNGRVESVSFSPDGKILASGSLDGIKLWNVESGQEIKSLKGHTNWVHSVAFSPNGKFLASAGGYDKTVKLWNVETGLEIISLKGHTSKTYSVRFSPDGRTLVLGDSENNIKLWNIESNQEIKSFIGHTDSVWSVAFSPDEKTIASGSSDDTIKLWNVKSGQEIKSLNGHTDYVLSVAFSPDGKILASGSADETIKLWNVATGKEFKSLIGHTFYVRSVAFSPDGKILASGSYDKTIKLWNVETGQEIKSLNGLSSEVIEVVFSPDGKILASESMDGNIQLWNTTSGQLLKSYQRGQPNTAKEVFVIVPDFYKKSESNPVTSDGNFQIKRSEKDSLDLVEFKTGKLLASLIALDETDWVIITPDGRFDASEGAQKLMHYAYGLEVINLEQLKEMYYEPGLLQKLLGFSKEKLRSIVPLKDVKLYPEIVGQNFDEKSGKLNIKLKNRGGGIGKTEVFVNDKRVVEDARDEKLKKNPNIALDGVVDLTVDLPVSAFVKGAKNEIKVITSNFLKEIGKGNIQSRGTAVFYLDQNKAETELPNLYAIVGGVSDYDGEQLDLNFAAKDAEDFSNALRLGANRLFCPQQTPDCLNKINITTLSTARESPQEQPTKENFKKAFAEIAKKAKPEDILVVYLSGHGITLGTDTDTYFYLTKEARSASKDDLAKTFQTAAISNAELTDWLTPNDKNPNDIWVNTGKQVIILDTCAAGNFAENDWKKDKDLSGDQIRAMDFLSGKTGTFILMGSAANRPSYEANRYNQGLLTFALLEGMKGSALQPATGNIDVGLLFDYATNRVPNLAKEMSLDQNPIIKRPSGNPFVFGQMTDDDKSKINLPKLKPMLLRPRFGSGEENDDPLNLVAELRKRFDAESSYETMKRGGKGEPVLIYVDDDSFPGAVRVTGTYTVEGENVRVKAFLRQDGKTIANFEVAAAKEKIADEIMNAVRTELTKN